MRWWRKTIKDGSNFKISCRLPDSIYGGTNGNLCPLGHGIWHEGISTNDSKIFKQDEFAENRENLDVAELMWMDREDYYIGYTFVYTSCDQIKLLMEKSGIYNETLPVWATTEGEEWSWRRRDGEGIDYQRIDNIDWYLYHYFITSKLKEKEKNMHTWKSSPEPQVYDTSALSIEPQELVWLHRHQIK